MKKALYFLLIFSIVLISCQKDPEANFSVDNGSPIVGHEVYFTNSSHNAENYEWDFGDGYGSKEKDPVHIFTATRSYEVTLTAISKKGLESKAYITLNVVIPTLLEIEVREYYDANLNITLVTVPDASVLLYPTITDWDAETNSVSEGFSDKYGIVVFSDLDQDDYFVDVWEATHDNYTVRAENGENIRIPDVIPNEINRFVAWCDYSNHGKGAGRSGRLLVIKKLERVIKTSGNSLAAPDTTGWRELYARSIRVKQTR